MFSARSCSPAEMKIFWPGELVAAVGLRLGLGAQQAEVGAAVRLGQAHRAGPLAAGQLGQVGRLLLGRAVRVQALVGAVRQAGVHGPGLVGRVQHLVEALVQHERQALAAVGRVAAQRRPAAFDIGRVGLLEALRARSPRGVALSSVQPSPSPTDVEREDHLGGELAALFEHRVDGVGIDLACARHAPAARRRRRTARAARTACRAGAGCTGPWSGLLRDGR